MHVNIYETSNTVFFLKYNNPLSSNGFDTLKL